MSKDARFHVRRRGGSNHDTDKCTSVFAPIIDCGHKCKEDGTCAHPDNMTPECHIGACPRLDRRIEKMADRAEKAEHYQRITQKAREDDRHRLQQKCSDWGTYWRASDAHGVKLTTDQAVELLQDALGVEVEIDTGISDAIVAKEKAELELGQIKAESVMIAEKDGILSHAFLRICDEVKAEREAAQAEVSRLRGMLSDAVCSIASERQRQITGEGWTTKHDDEHAEGQLATAGAVYALCGSGWDEKSAVKRYWPWDPSWLKTGDRRRCLVKAGALIVAEIDRLDRLNPAKGGGI